MMNADNAVMQHIRRTGLAKRLKCTATALIIGVSLGIILLLAIPLCVLLTMIDVVILLTDKIENRLK